MYPAENLLVFVFIIVLLIIQPCFFINSITQNKPLKDGDVLISDNEIFQLGFFSRGNSSNRYVGVWYYKIPEHTVVWVANRDDPLTHTSGVLSVDKTGKLVLFHSKTPEVLIWSSNTSSSRVGNYSAKLLDTGNFVSFKDQYSQKNIVWQGFDHPTDTFLPEMKLGWNKRTRENKFLTAWKSPDNPETGQYSFKFDMNDSVPQLFIFDGLKPIMRAGPWNGYTFSGSPGYTVSVVNDVTDLFYIDNEEEVSTYYILNVPTLLTKFAFNDGGVAQRLNWNTELQKWDTFWKGPDGQCDEYANCGTFSNCDPVKVGDQGCDCLPGYKEKSAGNSPTNTFQGCVRKSEASLCRNGEGFKEVPGVKIPDAAKAHLEPDLGIKACKVSCLKDCSCTAYTSANITNGKGCLTWHGDLVDVRLYSQRGQVLYLRVDSDELAKHPKKRLLVVLLPVLVIIFLIIIVAYWCICTKKNRGNNRNLEFSQGSEHSDISFMERYQDALAPNERGTGSTEVICFSLSTIVAATDNFSFSKKLGEGGFGTVYKGQLHSGQDIAVKRLSITSSQGIDEFKNEIILIAKLQHRNLVRLLGYCVQQEKMLIYEYLPNRGLDCFIFSKKSVLDWCTCFNIAMGIARGMVYLHQDSRLRIIHRDLKASNVLLDASINPKISDFGMARIVGSDQNEDTTKRVVGTYGYMAPEYAMEGLFSIKSDVFSYGVLLLEIISGRKNTSTFHAGNSVNLVGHVWNRWLEGKPLEIVDASLVESYEVGEVLRCIHVGLLCVQESAALRPTMSEVASMLCNERTPPSNPEQPAFINRAKVYFGPIKSSSSSGIGASADSVMTVTIAEGR